MMVLLTYCRKNEIEVIYDDVRTIEITKEIIIDNGSHIHNPTFNEITFEKFLKYIAASGHFLIVPLKDFNTTTSNDKVILSIRHDIDDNIESAVRFAYREHKYGISASYFFLHTSSYYGITGVNYFKRKDKVLFYLKKIQDSFGHEMGWHNDLVTLQVVYNIDPKAFLKTELAWLRSGGLNIYGIISHGSSFCYTYHYANSYFWEDVIGDKTSNFYNCENVPKDDKIIILEKDNIANYDLVYKDDDFHPDYFFADCDFPGGKRWNMGMVNWDTIKPGKKVILLLHPQHWD
jgi:hypothetical protein